MSENNLPTKAALLRLSSGRRAGVLQLAKDLHVGPAKVIRLISELRGEGLLDAGEVHTRRVGRPKRRFKATALGMEYLGAYEALQGKMLKSRRSDLRKAVADANYARRLASRGVSTYDLFLELNTFANHPRKIPG